VDRGSATSRVLAESSDLGGLGYETDVEEKPGGGYQIKPGREKDRVVRVQDAQMRPGRKSASKRFKWHKAAVTVEMESQLISGGEVLAGNGGSRRRRWPEWNSVSG